MRFSPTCRKRLAPLVALALPLALARMACAGTSGGHDHAGPALPEQGLDAVERAASAFDGNDFLVDGEQGCEFAVSRVRVIRFFITNVSNSSLVWIDTTPVAAGRVVDILLKMTNPGEWMAHRYIPEHLHAGMALVFRVEDADGRAPADDDPATAIEGHQH